jgi:hypothetical protein
MIDMQRQLKYYPVALAIVVLYSCAPQPPYRVPLPPSSAPSSISRAPQTPVPAPLPPTVEAARKPLPQESKIREQDIRTRAPTPVPAAKQASVNEPRGTTEPLTPPLPDDSSLLAKITPGVSPQRAASLRLTDEGRKLLDAGDPAKAITRLEKTIDIDSSNPYGYFYLAKAQYRLGRYKESLNFLDIAESRLTGEPFWLAEVHALRGENYRALGQTQRAEASYAASLRLNSGNRTAADALARLQGEVQPATAK